jgi:hypothetical protein
VQDPDATFEEGRGKTVYQEDDIQDAAALSSAAEEFLNDIYNTMNESSPQGSGQPQSDPTSVYANVHDIKQVLLLSLVVMTSVQFLPLR